MEHTSADWDGGPLKRANRANGGRGSAARARLAGGTWGTSVDSGSPRGAHRVAGLTWLAGSRFTYAGS